MKTSELTSITELANRFGRLGQAVRLCLKRAGVQPVVEMVANGKRFPAAAAVAACRRQWPGREKQPTNQDGPALTWEECPLYNNKGAHLRVAGTSKAVCGANPGPGQWIPERKGGERCVTCLNWLARAI
jgi:hypothetical protein